MSASQRAGIDAVNAEFNLAYATIYALGFVIALAVNAANIWRFISGRTPFGRGPKELSPVDYPAGPGLSARRRLERHRKRG